MGTEIFYGESMVPDDAWEHYLNHKWDRDIVMEETTKFPQLTCQVSNDANFLFLDQITIVSYNHTFHCDAASSRSETTQSELLCTK